MYRQANKVMSRNAEQLNRKPCSAVSHWQLACPQLHRPMPIQMATDFVACTYQWRYPYVWDDSGFQHPLAM